ATQIAFTAHSIPLTMAAGCDYQAQLLETCRLIAESLQHERWRLVFQSRSGPPTQAWLEPDIYDYLTELKEAGTRDVVIAPVGFISDHMEILYDLDTEARSLCEQINLNMVRAATVGTHPVFVKMIRELIIERTTPDTSRRFLGERGPVQDVCPADCCLMGKTGRPVTNEAAQAPVAQDARQT
ncbi:MAG TPA: ferrochelatase, partial [Pyrinomonadaceae bacterium]|nr:ferrochelatase [Pyrinomonadaceae bacterium]